VSLRQEQRFICDQPYSTLPVEDSIMSMQKTAPELINSFENSICASRAPGVGKLRNKIETMRMLALELASEVDLLGGANAFDMDAGIDLQEEVKAFEIALIRRALFKSGYCQAKAARMLRVNPTTLAYKIKTYEIEFLAEMSDMV
jgi:transcriptional regulator with GAF, ATPase, and Fis domain